MKKNVKVGCSNSLEVIHANCPESEQHFNKKSNILGQQFCFCNEPVKFIPLK